jgi:membrane-associated phospholipid phosphatase
VNYVQAVLFRNTSAINEGTATGIQTWGYVACMPSLHMAHELVMLYFARHSRVFFVGTLIFFLLTAVAVVALGWHYPTDILAGMLLGIVAILLSRGIGARMFPRPLRSSYAADTHEATPASCVRAG